MLIGPTGSCQHAFRKEGLAQVGYLSLPPGLGQGIARLKHSRRVFALLILMLASLVGLILLPPMFQNQNYHDFADQRTLFSIPHFWNVVSNIPFIGIGAAGLWQFGRSSTTMLL